MENIYFNYFFFPNLTFLEKRPKRVFPGIIICKKLDHMCSLCSCIDFILWFYFYSDVSHLGKIFG